MPGTWGPIATTPFSPVVEGDVLPQAPWPTPAGGVSWDVHPLVGPTRDEHRLLALEHGEVTDEEVTTALRLAPDGDQAAYPDATPCGSWSTPIG